MVNNLLSLNSIYPDGPDVKYVLSKREVSEFKMGAMELATAVGLTLH